MKLIFALYLLLLLPLTAFADDKDDYKLYRDVDDSYYLEERGDFVLIHADVSIPIYTASNYYQLFWDGEKWQVKSLTQSQWVTLGITNLPLENDRLLLGDFNGDLRTDLIIRGDTFYSDTLLLERKLAGVKVSQVNGYDHGMDLSLANSRLVVGDKNGDGIDDLIDGSKYLKGTSTGVMVYTGASLPPAGPVIQPGNTVGETAHQISTLPDGNLEIKVPISLPKAPAGLVPHVSLSYNSQYSPNGMGIMSYGWSLNATKVIHRCAKNQAIDGVKRTIPIQFTNQDRLCLNGKRLMLNGQGENGLVSDSQYWRANNQYHLEQDDGSTITAGAINSQYGTIGSFAMVDKSGTKYYFNHAEKTVGSKFQNGRTSIQGWKLTLIENRFAKKIVYNYDDSDVHEQRLDSIQYLGNGQSNYKAKVKFHYREAVDKRIHYRSNSITFAKNTKLLDKIEVSLDNQNYRTYQFGYKFKQQNGLSAYLTSIQEHAKQQTYQPLTFTWNEKQQLTAANIRLVKEVYVPYAAGALNLLADINGDGQKDLISVIDKQLYFRDAISGNAQFITSLDENYSNDFSFSTFIADVNGDGIDDVVYKPQERIKASHYLSWDGSKLVQKSTGKILRAVDVNGDGKHDLVGGASEALNDKLVYFNGINQAGEPLAINAAPLTAAMFPPPGVSPYGWSTEIKGVDLQGTEASHGDRFSYGLVGDINGDGYVDQVVDVTHATRGDLRTSRHIVYSNATSGYTAEPLNINVDELQSIDINGDRLLDAVKVKDDYLFVKINTGATGDQWKATGLRYARFIQDVNGDGIADLITTGKKGSSNYDLNLYLTHFTLNGNGYNISFEKIFTQHTWGYLGITDSNNNGKNEIALMVTGSKVRLYELNTPNLAKVTKVTSQGKTTSIDYLPIQNTQVYPEYNSEQKSLGFPYARLQQRELVRSVTYPTADGSSYRLDYQYFDGKVDQKGRGFLGFAKVISRHSRTGITTDTRYSQTYPYIGMVTAKTVSHSQGTISSDSATLAKRTSAQGGVLAYVKNSTSKKYDLASNGSNPLVSQTASSLQLDSWGNATSQTNTVTGDGKSYSTTTATAYNGSNYSSARYGRASSQTKTFKRTGEANKVSTVAYHYYSHGGLKSEIIQPGDVNQLTTSYVYDSYGNIHKISKAGRVNSSGTKQTRTETFTYANNGRLLASHTNALNHTQQYEYNNASAGSSLGPITQQVHFDQNGLASETHFDYFGREVQTIGRNHVITQISRDFCASDCANVTQAYTKVVTSTQGQPETTQYFDRFGNAVGEAYIGFDGQAVVSQQKYDWQGRVYEVSQPGKGQASSVVTRTAYDVLSRARSVTLKASGGDRTTRWAYNGRVTTVTEPNNATHTKTVNALGEPIVSKDVNQLAVNFYYYANGQLRLTRVGGDAKTDISYQYDIFGNKTAVKSPGKGAESYTYNAFAEMLSSKNAKNQTVLYGYDSLGRQTWSREAEGVNCWRYDSAQYGVGQLAQTFYVPNGLNCTSDAQANINKLYSYNNRGLQSAVTTKLGSASYQIVQHYDQYARLDQLDLPATTQTAGKFSVAYDYNSQGHLHQVRQLTGSAKVLQQILATDALGNVTQQKLGNGVTLNKNYRQDTGEASSINVANRLATSYTYNTSGNMASRVVRFGYGSNVRQYQQSFGYDAINRLKTVTDTASKQLVHSYQYDNLGNITPTTPGQSDPGYVYDPNHPYKLLRHKGETLNYDASGNITNYNGYQFSYTSFDKVKRISNPRNANDWTEYSYGTDGERFKKVENRIYQGKVERLTTEFIHAFYERHSRSGGAGNLVEEKYFIGDMVLTQRSNNTKDSFYTIKDQQGSVLMTLNGSGQEVNRYYYRPFGEQLDVSLNPLGLQTLRPTQYGYTGHEHVKDLDIINMGGRIYAAGLRRFLQADPVVGHPMYSQSYNPYQYVYGNPLVNVDPSGYTVIPQNFGPVFATGSIFIGFATLAQLGGENPWSMRGLIHEHNLNIHKQLQKVAHGDLDSTTGTTSSEDQDITQPISYPGALIGTLLGLMPGGFEIAEPIGWENTAGEIQQVDAPIIVSKIDVSNVEDVINKQWHHINKDKHMWDQVGSEKDVRQGLVDVVNSADEDGVIEVGRTDILSTINGKKVHVRTNVDPETGRLRNINGWLHDKPTPSKTVDVKNRNDNNSEEVKNKGQE